MRKNISKFVYWTPRILSILFLLFLVIFSFDVFESCNGFFQCAFYLFMHNIPVLILLAVLLISWKHEIVGGIGFILAGLLYSCISIIRVMMSNPVEWYMLSWSLIIAGPAFFIGILFLMNWHKKKK